jgi:hypothetical protein
MPHFRIAQQINPGFYLVAIYNRALTAVEVNGNFLAGAHP